MIRLRRTSLALLFGALVVGSPLAGQNLLVPMDGVQTNHLKAYGLTYWVLAQESSAEWLLNYRGGAFLLPDLPAVRREAALRGVTVEPASAAEVARIRGVIQAGNMESVPLETAPEIAVYTPPNATPWDDAVTMVLTYADIPYETIWDPEVLDGDLSEYDWLHLHHEDFTGQYSKFFISYQDAVWLQDEVARNEEVADAFGFADVPGLKRAVAEEIRAYVEAGGFLFAMCSATETLDLALASHGTDISANWANGRPPDPDANDRMDWPSALAFTGARVELSPAVNAFSDIDYHLVNTNRRESLGYFTLFDFSAKIDPISSMLVQNHEALIPDFYGLTTAFRRSRLKPGVTVLAEEGTWAKYIHGSYGAGTFTFYGGHDPEDPEHQIGDPPTNLDLHPDSPGYRLILNNVLFPAARPRPLET
ncbi:MAG: asparagine synthetase B [Gemmatimonadota bacterium]